TNYQIDELMARHRDSLRQMVEFLGFTKTKLDDQLVMVTQTILGTEVIQVPVNLTGGFAYGLENVVVYSPDEFTIITQEPLLAKANLTVAEAEVDYNYTTLLNSGRITILVKDLKAEVTFDTKTGSVDLKIRFISHGDTEITFSESNLDPILPLFEWKVKEIFSELTQHNIETILLQFQNKLNEVFPESAKLTEDTVKEELQKLLERTARSE
ncbi:hypothetical protein QAD02_005696, partial [Eretmocerus hayati]